MANIKITKKLVLNGLSVFGLIISGYLTYIKFSADPYACRFGRCAEVQSSIYSEIFGIPVAVLGVVFYLIFLALNNKTRDNVYLKLWVVWGIAFSTYLTYIELFVIEAVCGLCVLSFITILLAALTLWFPAAEGDNDLSSI